MNRKYFLVGTLVITFLLLGSVFSVPNINATNLVGRLEVKKKVWDGESWVNSIDAELDDVVQFKIKITYYNETAGVHYAYNIVINDLLPDGFEYITGSAYPYEPDSEIGYSGGTLYQWDLGDSRLFDGQTYIIKFNATVVECGENINRVEVSCDEYCTGAVLTGYDIATVNVECDPADPPEIDVEKWIWDGYCDWVREIYVYSGTTIGFKIIVTNTGGSNLTNIIVNDIMSTSLEYANNATVNGDPWEPDDITPGPSGTHLLWTFNYLEVGDTIEIEFDAIARGDPCEEDTNWVNASGMGGCDEYVEDEDTVSVFINGMCFKKEVWDKDTKDWTEEATIGEGEIGKFKITVTYFGRYKLYNIKIRDELPSCLVYADSATLNGAPYEPDVSTDGKTLWWNLSGDYVLYDGESLVIIFEVTAGENNCQPCVNLAYIIANECSGNIFDDEDSATLLVECAFIADAGGPYYGEIEQDIAIAGSVTGGTAPYSYSWDMDDDGQYDDATGKTVDWSWGDEGNYVIRLKAIDDDGSEAFDYAYVEVEGGNVAPYKPNKPSGPMRIVSGQKITYQTSTIDNDDDDIYYWFDWGDGTNSGWVGPVPSNTIADANHTWSASGLYSIKVKAKDTHDAESVWSDPLQISVPRNRFFTNNPIIMKFFEMLLEKLPILKLLI